MIWFNSELLSKQTLSYHVYIFFIFYNCSDFCLFYRIQTQWYLYTMLALSIYNKCSHRQSCLITPGQSVNLLIQEDMVSLDCEHSWLISGKKILENFDIRTLFLMHKYIYLEKKTALGLNLIFCLNLQKTHRKLLIDVCYCFNLSSLFSRFASPVLEHWPTLDNGLWPSGRPSAPQLYVQSGGERWLVDSLSGCLGLCTANRRRILTFQFCGFGIKVGLKKRERIGNL